MLLITKANLVHMMKSSNDIKTVIFLPPAAKYIKKLKDKKLKDLIKNTIDKIAKDYTIGELKKGDLSGIYCYDIYYNKTNYEIAYRLENNKIIVIIMVGTRENFYDEIKKYLK